MRNRCCIALLLMFLLWVTPGFSQVSNTAGKPADNASHASGVSTPTAANRVAASADPFNTAYNYVVTFYPRWFTWLQPLNGFNRLVGPDHISEIYQGVVAINDDTLYTSSFFSSTNDPVMVTVPPTTDVYSVLILDQFGKVLPGIPSANPSPKPALYALIGPGWNGTLPDGAIPVYPGVNNGEIIFRADKYVKNNGVYQDMRQEAENFRSNICLIPLSQYQPCPNAGQAKIVPEAVFGFSYKKLAVTLIANHPVLFLATLQTALKDPNTNPLTSDEQMLSDEFDTLFQDKTNWPLMAAAAQAAHTDIDLNYETHTVQGTNWVNFTDIGIWTQDFTGYLNRSGVTDYCQYCNNASAALYFPAFVDGNGVPLDGSAHNYVLTFQAGQQPDVKRFWSVTAYLPITIELAHNSENKYVVGSYTPGLVTAQDGSVSVVMAVNKPDGVPEANWLPIPDGPFSLLLRAYGPNWNQQNNPYSPPTIQVLP